MLPLLVPPWVVSAFPFESAWGRCCAKFLKNPAKPAHSIARHASYFGAAVVAILGMGRREGECEEGEGSGVCHAEEEEKKLQFGGLQIMEGLETVVFPESYARHASGPLKFSEWTVEYPKEERKATGVDFGHKPWAQRQWELLYFLMSLSMPYEKAFEDYVLGGKYSMCFGAILYFYIHD